MQTERFATAEKVKTTQIYAKITKEKISQDMEALSHKLESLEKQIVERI